MAPEGMVALLVGALSLASPVAALNYSTMDMMRAQLSLMDDRPKDCPPW